MNAHLLDLLAVVREHEQRTRLLLPRMDAEVRAAVGQLLIRLDEAVERVERERDV